MTLDHSGSDLSRYAVRDDDDNDPELVAMPGAKEDISDRTHFL